MLNSRVRRVRLTAASESQLPRARKLLADALMQSDVGLASGRLWIVRTIKVGSIGIRAAPADVSALIENDVRRLQRTAVRGEDSAAGDAAMVYFESALTACVALALRLCRGKAAREWFWPLAVPQYRPGMERRAALRAVLFGALENDPPSLSAAALSVPLSEHRCLHPLIEALRPDDGALLLARCGWHASYGDGAAPAAGERLSHAHLPPSSAMALREVLHAGDAPEDVKLWLCCALLVAAAPHRADDAQLTAKAREAIAHLGRDNREARRAPRPERGRAPVIAHLAQRRPLQWDADAANESARELQPSAPPAFEAHGDGHRSLPVNSSTRIGEPARQARTRVGVASAALSPAGDRMSANAGLLFLVNAVARLGIERWLAANAGWADWGLVPRLFAALADRLAIPASDPVVTALPRNDGGVAAPSGFALPLSWQALAGASRIEQRSTAEGHAGVICALSGRLPLAGRRAGVAAAADLPSWLDGAPAAARPYSGSLEDALIDAWVNAMRLWCRTVCGVGLLAVVRRTGRVFCSSTHVSASFELDATDIRLRRVGLDVDPGWLPWFGRVVNFSYGACDGDE